MNFYNIRKNSHLTGTLGIQFQLQSAHLAMTEAMMSLFAKEQVNPDRALSAIERMDSAGLIADEDKIKCEAKEPEQALLAWADACCKVLKAKSKVGVLYIA